MSYKYKIENLDCANCAAKMQAAVSKLAGIKMCTINFFTLKMNLETEYEMTDELLNKIEKTIKKYESNVKLKTI